MKEIRATLQPYKLDDVLLALAAIPSVPAATVLDARTVAPDDPARELPKIRLELIVEDDRVEEIVRAIVTAAHTGHAGDGRVVVVPIERTVLIREGRKDGGIG